MEKVKFIIEQGEKNYSCFSEDVPGVAATGKTLSQLKINAKEALEFHIEGCREDGDEIPDVVQGNYEVGFVFDTQNFLQYYEDIFSRAALSRITGINEKQLGHYIQGIHKPRKDKAKKIQECLHTVGKELLSVELV